MGFGPAALPGEVLAFLSERHLATLTTLGRDGRPHVVAVGFTFDPGAGLVRIITGAATRKAVNARRGGRAPLRPGGGAPRLALGGPGTGAAPPPRVAGGGGPPT